MDARLPQENEIPLGTLRRPRRRRTVFRRSLHAQLDIECYPVPSRQLHRSRHLGRDRRRLSRPGNAPRSMAESASDRWVYVDRVRRIGCRGNGDRGLVEAVVATGVEGRLRGDSGGRGRLVLLGSIPQERMTPFPRACRA